MRKSIWDIRFSNYDLAQDEYVQVEEGDSWKTIHGAHVLLGDDGRIKAGAGGKFDGSNLELYKRTDKNRIKKMQEEVYSAAHEAHKKAESMLLEKMKSGELEKDRYFRERYKIWREAEMQATVEYLKQQGEYSNPPKPLAEPMSEEDAIARIAGGDETVGSCASAATAYIANQILGLDVRDFRGGASQAVGSCSALDALDEIWESGYDSYEEGGGIFTRGDNKSLLEDMMYALDTMKPNELYVAMVGGHMALVRATDEGEKHGEIEYLELQSPHMRSPGGAKTVNELEKSNGWKPLVMHEIFYGDLDERTKELGDKLEKRFGLTNEGEWNNAVQGVVPAKRFAETEYMKKLLPYINTAEDKQLKSNMGGIK